MSEFTYGKCRYGRIMLLWSQPPVVGALIETFTSMLADKVLEEVSLIASFKTDFEFLCDELVSVKLLLDEAGQNSTSLSMSNWLEKLEYFVIDAVDILDECRATKFGDSIFSNFEKLLFRHRMGSKIRTLRERINNIHRSAKYLKHLMAVLHVNALNAHNLEDKRERSSALLKESQIVGMKDAIDDITKLILAPQNRPQVIVIVGMGGMGKTLLVERVVKSQKVQEGFDRVVWLPVSQNFDMLHLLLDIAKKMKLPFALNQNMTHGGNNVLQSPDLTPDSVRREILEDLERSGCLFVLDDLWNIDVFHKIDWLLCKSKIVVTTRDRRVVNTNPSYKVHEYPMKCLSDDDSMKLFCIHAFPDSADTQQEGRLPKVLEKVANQIVQKCGQLPLALKTIGASMARVKRLPNDWESIVNSLNEEEAMSDEVMPSLRLSYHALPYRLKLCFDYCSSFPKNSRIKSEYLVNAWIAEGYTPQTTENPYDVGLSYIDELIDRCLLEVSKVGGDSRVKYCKMHDILHDLALSESRKKTKCLLKPGKKLQKFPMGESVGLRRISLIENNISTIREPIKCPGLRTLLLCNNVDLKLISPSFLSDMKYLAVLDLGGTAIDSLPETVGQLNHLRFLNLSNTKIAKLPKSLAKLKSLQFLDVSLCDQLVELHSGIVEHKSMLHLNVKGSAKLKSLPVGISNLIYLHTLKGLVFKREKAPTSNAFQLSTVLKYGEAENAKALQWWDLKKLIHLQHLSLTLDAPSSDGIIRLEEGTFEDMTMMRSLSFKYIDSREGSSGILHLPEDIKVMQRLEILHLKSCAVQDWIFELQNLMELDLFGDNGSTLDYRELQNIPNLRKLKLSTNYNCVEFPPEFGKRGAFPKLEIFVIKSFGRLKNILPLEDGALPMLKSLQMKYCDQLQDITEDIKEAFKRPSGTLEEIRVKKCPKWELGIWKNERTWQLLKGDEKDRPIKLTINGYTVSWALDQHQNSLSEKNSKDREKLRLSLLVCIAATVFDASTSSAGDLVVERNIQNGSGVEGRQQEIIVDGRHENSNSNFQA